MKKWTTVEITWEDKIQDIATHIEKQQKKEWTFHSFTSTVYFDRDLGYGNTTHYLLFYKEDTENKIF